MTKIKDEALVLAEKFVDSEVKIGDFSILGISLPVAFEEVGMLGILVSGIKISSYIRDKQFTKAFQNFTAELSGLTADEKQNFFNKYSQKRVEDFGEQALLLLNKIETSIAAKMIGKAHYLLILGDIEEERYNNYCHIIKNLNLYLLKNIRSIYEKHNDVPESGGLYTTLFNLGLMCEAEQKLYPGSLPPKTYVQSLFGWEFYNQIVQPFINEF